MNLRQRAADEDGAAAVEFVVVAPMLVFFAFACLQLAVLLFTCLSVMSATRDLTRWVSLNPNTIDSAAIAAFDGRLTPALDASKLAISISPACPSLTQGKCPNRAAGQDVTISLSYNISSLYFLPMRLELGGNTLQLPVSLPAYSMHIQAEPS